MMTEPIAYLIVGTLCVGMGVSFYAADPHGPTSRSLGLMFVLLGITAWMNLPATASRGEPAFVLVWHRVYSVLDPIVIATGLEWIRRIGRTEASASPAMNDGDTIIRVGQAAAVAYGLAGIVFPEARARVWFGWNAQAWREAEFYLFAVPFNLAILLGLVRLVQVSRADIDPAERLRLWFFALATPFWTSAVFVSDRFRPLAGAAGAVVFLVGAIRYHALQGRRAQFLARFLSPDVAALVRDRGLAGVLERRRVEISVVACDLRNFTAFTERAAPEEVVQLLDEIHGAIGDAAVAHGGSVKDFAGDGALALVGAPVPQPDHARRALGLAIDLRERIERLLERRSIDGVTLGVGVGAASGFVTVGGLGGRSRLEYAAVGPAVNIASRLCARAEAGQIVVDERLVALAGDDAGVTPLGAVELKGFASPITIFAIERGNR